MALWQRFRVVLLFVVIPTLIFAQFGVTGKIKGRVIDSMSGEPLVGADVMVLPTNLGIGASTDGNGKFIITSVPVGTHDVQARYMGYSTMKIKGVSINPGMTTPLNFELTEQTLESEEVTVTAEAQKTAVSVRVAKSQRQLKGDEVQRMPVVDFTDVLTSTAGIVETGGGLSGGIHVRGGRTGELKYVIDGIDVTDPVTGEKGMDIDIDAIETVQITQNFFSASYGGKLSGITEIVSKSGSRDRFEGSFKYQTDGMFSEPDFDVWGKQQDFLNNGFNKYNFFLSGPVPMLNGDLRFSLSGALKKERQHSASFIVMPHNKYEKASGILKLSYSRESSPFKIEMTASLDSSYQEYYAHNRSLGNWLDDYYTRQNQNRRVSLKFSDATGFWGDGVWTLTLSNYRKESFGTVLKGSHFREFNVISTMLPWVNYAYRYALDDNYFSTREWYNTETREWYEDRIPAGTIKEDWKAPAEVLITDNNGNGKYDDGDEFIDFNYNGVWDDASNVYNLTTEEQVYYYYYTAVVESFDPESGKFGYKNPNSESFTDDTNGVWDSAEDFTDANGNGFYDYGEEFTDANGNGAWDDEEPLDDVNGNGTWDDGESFTDRGNGLWDEGEFFKDYNGNGIWDEGEHWEYPEYGSFLAIANEVDARNNRFGDTGYWWAPALLDTFSVYYDTTDFEVYYQYFDVEKYNTWLTQELNLQDALVQYANGDISQDELNTRRDEIDSLKSIYELNNYNGDIHWTARWNRDDFGLFSFGIRPRYNPHTSDISSVDFDWTSQLNLNNEIQFGFNFRHAKLEETDIQWLNRYPYFDHWSYAPTDFAAYGVWRFEYEDLISDLGLRVNGFDADAPSLTDPEDFSQGRKETPIKIKIAPRLSVSFAASDKTSLSLNYGYKYQLPPQSEMFMNLQADINNGYPILGNPDLEMQAEKAYDLLIKHEFTPEIGIEIDAYYRDQLDLLKTESYTTVLADGTVGRYTAYTAGDFAKIKGVDFRFNLLGFHGLSGEFTYSFLDAKGTGSSPREFYYNYMLTSSKPPTKQYPLEYDITHSIDANINYGIAPGEGPVLLGMHLFGYSNLNVQLGMQSGAPYTPVDSRGNPQEIGSKRMPWSKHVNAKFEKAIPLFGKKSLTFFVQVWNLFAWENIVNVNSFTGLPDTNGYPPEAKSGNYPYWRYYQNPETGEKYRSWYEMYEVHKKRWEYRMKSPFNYGSPRTVSIGTSIRF